MLNLAAAGAGQIAAKQRLEHQHQRIALHAAQLLAQHVGGDGPHLREGNGHADMGCQSGEWRIVRSAEFRHGVQARCGLRRQLSQSAIADAAMRCVLRQGQQREVDRIDVIAQIEHAREAGAGEFGFVPGAVGAAACRADSRCRARRRRDRCRPAAIRPSRAQAVCEAVTGPWPRSSRLGVAVGRFAPAAARLLMGEQPVGAAPRSPDRRCGTPTAARPTSACQVP